MRLNAPRSIEGAQVWDLVMRCGGQLRATSGKVIGYDMTAVMAMGDALGVPRPAIAEWLPGIEAEMQKAINTTAEAGNG